MQFPERDYLFAFTSIINPDTSKKIVSKVRENRSISITEDHQNLVKTTEEMRNVILTFIRVIIYNSSANEIDFIK